ncbi:MAG: HAMP domain-containing histidine kinase [Paramuribaculum sp.]|nr:HAMP domain-containing histidine kinase [Paramuribaculum sp.]
MDSLKNRLANAESLSDSIALLYNIYDCSPSAQQGEVLETLYDLAMRRADYHTVNDVLRQSANHYAANDSMQRVLIARAENLPESPEKQSTLVYMNVIATSNSIKSLSQDEREDKLHDYLARHTKSESFDTYKRIEYLFELCAYLRMSTEGELLTNYFQELQALIDELPESNLALKYLFYRQAAKNYLSNGMIPEAVRANKELLDIMGEYEKQYTSQSRTFINYDVPAFECYRRLLLCHDALTKEEVDEYYSKINALIDRNPALRELPGETEKIAINYMMAKNRYAEAIPLIKEQLNDPANSREVQFYLVDALIKAAEAVGDKENLLMALDMSNEMLKKRIEKKTAESYKELQTIYEVNDLKETNEELRLANQQIVINRHKEQLTYGIAGLVVLVILLVLVFVLYRRSKRLTSNLTKSNALVVEERDALQRARKDLIEARDKAKIADRIRNDFINNMGHEIRNPLESIVEYSGLVADCADSARRDNLKRFADVITLNTDLLLTLVNDVLDLPSLENAKFSVHVMKASLQKICNIAIDNVKRHIKPGIELIFANAGQPDATITTDPHRVEQVLLNLLMNAAKFTDEGTITLEYTVSPMHDKVTFTVTDTGIGIPQGKEEVIFLRSAQLDSETQGTGLGLYISRLLANMLGGSLTLDNDYRTGAKFIFTIPIS